MGTLNSDQLHGGFTSAGTRGPETQGETLEMMVQQASRAVTFGLPLTQSKPGTVMSSSRDRFNSPPILNSPPQPRGRERSGAGEAAIGHTSPGELDQGHSREVNPQERPLTLGLLSTRQQGVAEASFSQTSPGMRAVSAGLDFTAAPAPLCALVGITNFAAQRSAPEFSKSTDGRLSSYVYPNAEKSYSRNYTDGRWKSKVGPNAEHPDENNLTN